MARPEENLDTLPENWYNDILDLYKEGASDVEVKSLIYSWRGSFSNDLWSRWIADYEEFSETIKTGKILAESWWSRNGRTNLTNKDFSYTGWYMQMKNRYNWTDRNDITTQGEKTQNNTPIQIEIVKPNESDNSI